VGVGGQCVGWGGDGTWVDFDFSTNPKCTHLHMLGTFQNQALKSGDEDHRD